MDECSRCKGTKVIKVESAGTVLIRPCPKCNSFADHRQKEIAEELEKIMSLEVS